MANAEGVFDMHTHQKYFPSSMYNRFFCGSKFVMGLN